MLLSVYIQKDMFKKITKNSKRSLATFFAVLFLFSLAVPIINSVTVYAEAPPSPQAIKKGNFTWYDRYTIHATIGGKTYYARFKEDGGFNYYFKNSDCYGRIQFYRNVYGNFAPDAPAPGKAKVDMDFMDPTLTSPDCQNTDEVNGFPGEFPNIDIGKPGNFNIFFIVAEDGRHLLDVSDDHNDYTQSNKYANLFVRDSEDGDHCQDVIQVNKARGTYKSYEMDEDSDGGKPPASVHAANDCQIIDGDSDYANVNVDQKLGEAQRLKNDVNPDDPSVSAGGATGDDETPACGTGLSLGWIICGITEAVQSFGDWVFKGYIQPMMEKNPLSTDPKDPFYQSWQGFRFLANLLLIVSLLAVVYSQTRGGNG